MLAVFLLAAFAAAPPATPLELVVSAAREGGCTVQLRNVSTRPVQVLAVAIEAAELAGQPVRADIGCPCGAKCKKATLLLAPGQSTRQHWDQFDDSCAAVAAGRYRAVARGTREATSGVPGLLGHSAAFELPAPQ